MVAKKKKAAPKPKAKAKEAVGPVTVLEVTKYAGLLLRHDQLIVISDGTPACVECGGPVRVTIEQC